MGLFSKKVSHKAGQVDKSRLPRHVGKHGTVIRGVGLGKRWIFVGVGFPVEGAAVNDHAA